MKPLWINYFSNLFIGVSLNNFIYFCQFSEVDWVGLAALVLLAPCDTPCTALIWWPDQGWGVQNHLLM